MGALSKSSILGSEDRPRVKVEVPEWGGYVWVRALSAAELDQYQASRIEGTGKKRTANLHNLRASLCILAVVDDDNHQIFQAGDAEALGAKSAKAVDRIFEIAQRQNALTEDSVEDLEKNSAGAPGGASSSDSPSPWVVPFPSSAKD